MSHFQVLPIYHSVEQRLLGSSLRNHLAPDGECLGTQVT